LKNNILKNINKYNVKSNNNSIIFYSGNFKPYQIELNAAETPQMQDLVNNFFNRIDLNQEYKELVGFGNEKLFKIIGLSLKSYFENGAVSLLSNIDSLGDVFKELKFKFILTSSNRLNLFKTILSEISRSLKIPIITYQEGGGAGYLNWPMFDFDADYSDSFLVYGDRVKTYYEKNSNNNIKSVGSIKLGNIKKSIGYNSKDSKIYFILDNLKSNMYQHYPYNGGFFSLAYKHQLRIMELLDKFKYDACFLIKTVKDKQILYKSILDEKYFEISSAPLQKILDNASAFILDTPGTGLLECLMTDKPIAVLYRNELIRFEEDALNMLSKRIKISDNYDEYSKIISELIIDSKSNVKYDVINDFTSNYCVKENNEKLLTDYFNSII
jgi:hypothetical protein